MLTAIINLLQRIFIKPYKEFMEDYDSKPLYVLTIIALTVPVWVPILYFLLFN